MSVIVQREGVYTLYRKVYRDFYFIFTLLLYERCSVVKIEGERHAVWVDAKQDRGKGFFSCPIVDESSTKEKWTTIGAWNWTEVLTCQNIILELLKNYKYCNTFCSDKFPNCFCCL